MRYEPRGLARWANTDASLHCNGPVVRSRWPRWRGAQDWCLKHCDYDAAELIASRNLVSDECAAKACSDCFFSWCRCSHHSVVQFELEHPQFRSPSEVESEREALEVA